MAKESVLGTKTVVQVGVIVKNIEETAAAWADFLGIDVPAINPTAGYEESQSTYKGNRSDATSKLAFIDVNEGLQLELIEPDGLPSTWQDHLDKHGEGVHHLAFTIQDTKGKVLKMQELGFPLLQTGEWGTGRYAYFDTLEKLKLIVETLEHD